MSMSGPPGPKEASDDHSRNRTDDCCVAKGLAPEGSPSTGHRVGIGFLIGTRFDQAARVVQAAVIAAGGTMENVMPLFLLPELALGALIVMANRRPANASVPARTEASAFSDRPSSTGALPWRIRSTMVRPPSKS